MLPNGRAKEMNSSTFKKRAEVILPHSNFQLHSFFLQPWVDDKRVGAFWFVEPTSDPEKVNMVKTEGHYSAAGGVEIQSLSNINLLEPDKSPKLAPATLVQKPAGTVGHKGTGKSKVIGKSKVAVEQEPAQSAASVDAPEASRQAEEVNIVRPPEDAHLVVACVPILVNSKDLKAAEKLFFFEKPQKRNAPEAAGPIQISKIVKSGKR